LTEENKELKENSVSAEMIDALVKERSNIVSVADKAQVEVKDEMSNVDIMKAVIMKKSPKANLDGKDDVYIQARFDSIVESLDDEEKGDEATRTLKGDSRADSDSTIPSPEEKRKQMVDYYYKRSRGIKE
jgi:hypothetical protein